MLLMYTLKEDPTRLKRIVRVLRNQEGPLFELKQFRLDTFFRWIFREGPRMWNLLPLNIRICEDKNCFKRILKKHLKTEYLNL